MIKALVAKLQGAVDNEVVRKLLGLPRYTPQQVTAVVRKQATEYIGKLELLTLDDETHDSLKLILSQPVDSPQENQAVGMEISDLLTDFFEEQGMAEPIPLFEQRWQLALMTSDQYVTAVNSINNIYQRLMQQRAIWVQTQVEAAQEDLADDQEAQEAYQELTKELGPMISDEVGEA